MSGWRIQKNPVGLLFQDRALGSGLEELDDQVVTKILDYGFYLLTPDFPVTFYPWSSVQWVREEGFGDTSAVAGLLDHSGGLLFDGVSQLVMDANPSRQYLLFQNVSETTLWLSFGSAEALMGPPSLAIEPGAAFVSEGKFVPSEAVNVIGAFAGSSFVAKEDDDTTVLVF